MVTLPPPQPRHHTFRQPELEGEQGQRQIHGATLGHTDPRGKRRLGAVGEDPGVQGALGIGGALWIAPHPSSGPSSPAHADGDAVLTSPPPPDVCGGTATLPQMPASPTWTRGPETPPRCVAHGPEVEIWANPPWAQCPLGSGTQPRVS